MLHCPLTSSFDIFPYQGSGASCIPISYIQYFFGFLGLHVAQSLIIFNIVKPDNTIVAVHYIIGKHLDPDWCPSSVS